MTNSDRWRVIAEAFDTPPEERTPRQRDMTWCGLCFAWKYLTGQRKRYEDLSFLVGDTFQRPARRNTRDAIRATLAGLLAAMTERERRALWREAGR